jgi:hypothetical protein
MALPLELLRLAAASSSSGEASIVQVEPQPGSSVTAAAVPTDTPIKGFADVGFEASGVTYTGDIEDGVRHGRGTLVFADGTRYAGAFERGAMAGVGALSLPDGSEYRGDFAGGKRHGFGTLTMAGGAPQYIGSWVAGQREGKVSACWPPSDCEAA